MAVRLRELACFCVALSFLAACGKPRDKASPAGGVASFAALFSENCSGCHGVNGKRGAAQSLNDPVFLAVIPKETIRQRIEHGVPGTPMPAFAIAQGGPLDAKRIDALVNGIEKNWAKPVNFHGVTVPPYDDAGAIPDVAHGEQVFGLACAQCHGSRGRAGSIVDGSFLSLVSNQSLRTAAIVGRPDYGMPDWRAKMPGHPMTDREVTDVVGFLSSLRPADAGTELSSTNGVAKQP